MRIIAGEYKGRRLLTPPDNLVRPTSEKVKEAMFSILAPDIDEAVVCDLFSGTGSLGLEALSRGAGFCYFGDHAGESIKLIKENVTRCKAERYASILHGNYLRTLDRITSRVNIFILDPPYKKGLIEKSIEAIVEKELLADGGMVVAEHHRDEEIPEEICALKRVKVKKYGIVVLSIYM